MPRASVVWTGHLTFGLVSVPVCLYAAARTETVKFTRLQKKKTYKPIPQFPGAAAGATSLREGLAQLFESPVREGLTRAQELGFPGGPVLETEDQARVASASQPEPVEYFRVKQALISEDDGNEVNPRELVKGYQVGPDQFVAISREEYDRAAVETSETIDLFHFVPAGDVDIVYLERSYYLVPLPGGEKAYALLFSAMKNKNVWGVARIGMHRREHILILRLAANGLVAHTMFLENEVRQIPEFRTDLSQVNERELRAAELLVEGYLGEFKPAEFRDIYQERLHELINSGTRNAPGMPALIEEENILPDLMASINQSLAEIQHKKKASGTQDEVKPNGKARPKPAKSKRKLERVS
jgi:DNA end-binding protein Ku